MVGLCRLCASLKKPDLLTNIKDQSNEICQKLQKCCRVNIQMTDALPKSVCQECVEQLNLSHKFYTKVQEAQETLQALFPNQQPEKGNDSLSDSPSKDMGKPAIKQSNTAEEVLEKSLKRLKKQQGNIKIENAGIERPTQCSDTRDAFAVTSKVPATEDDNAADNDGYLQEVYDILGMAKDDNGEEERIDILISSLDKDEQHHPMIQEEHHYLEAEDHVLLETEETADEDDIESRVEKVDEDMQIEEVVIENEQSDEEIILSDNFDFEEDNASVANNEGSSNNVGGAPDTVQGYSCLPLQSQISSWKCYNYLCYACPYKTSTCKDLVRHVERVHSVTELNKVQFKCYDCQKIISRYSAFLNHVRLKHHPALKLRCDACDLLCSDYKTYKIHRDISCAEAKTFPVATTCSFCFKSFCTSTGLLEHNKLHRTSNPKERFECKFCQKEFKRKTGLRYHESTHTKAPEYACEYCDKLYLSRSSLEAHLYTHVDDKLFKCHICQKNFKSYSILEKHQITHTNVRPFNCSYCERQFRTKIEQTTHERVHTGEMPLQCTHCEKRFRFRSALNAHLKVHSGVRAYSCKYCSKSFADISNFKKHVRRKHADEESAVIKKE